jgi:hypothetical protein
MVMDFADKLLVRPSCCVSEELANILDHDPCFTLSALQARPAAGSMTDPHPTSVPHKYPVNVRLEVLPLWNTSTKMFDLKDLSPAIVEHQLLLVGVAVSCLVLRHFKGQSRKVRNLFLIYR